MRAHVPPANRSICTLFLASLALCGSACRSSAPPDAVTPLSTTAVVDAPATRHAQDESQTATESTRPRASRTGRGSRAPETADAVEAHGFGGLWQTTYGTMRLALEGDRARGTYSYSSGSRIEGRVEGNTLHATYVEPTGAKGRALFEIAEDGASFRGVWRADERELAFDDRDAKPWSGSRVHPVPGRTWLVILEAHWEESLADHEFSYGAMLRAFFERIPAVEVRHRYFHDRADFVRFCSETAELAEPVVLYISSHGSPQGVVAGADTIDGRTIGECLRDAGDLRLVHLGACDALAGSLGAEILAAAAPHARFPISGFTESVDWAGSAIVDFTYLDLVFEHDLDPVEAVRCVRSMVSFAGAAGHDGDAIPGTNLTLYGARE